MDRHDIALPGLFEYFKNASLEEREHATKFMQYQNNRGGRIDLTDVSAPEKSEWGSAKDAMVAALQLEKDVNEVIAASLICNQYSL
jgi:ferritin heavy chain